MSRARGEPYRMSARAAADVRGPFSARVWEGHDAGVAIDEVTSLPDSIEPLFLRVERGRARQASDPVVGDWLCERGSPPRRVPLASWAARDRRAEAWARGRRWVDAWESCERGTWMIDAAASVRLDPALIVGAAAACARAALRRVDPRGAARGPRGALESVAGWRGGHLEGAYVGAERAVGEFLAGGPPRSERRAAISALDAVRAAHFYSVGQVAAASGFAVDAVSYSADLPDDHTETDEVILDGLRRAADVVLAAIPTIDVVRASLKRAQAAGA